jgi:hypothetical protein
VRSRLSDDRCAGRETKQEPAGLPLPVRSRATISSWN